MFRKTNQSGKMTSAGVNHLQNVPVQPKPEVIEEDQNVFKIPVVKRKKLKFQRQ